MQPHPAIAATRLAADTNGDRRPGRAPLHVMHVVHAFGIGGLENGVVNLINSMDPGRFSHSICCISRSGASAGLLRRTDVSIHELGKGDRRELLLSLRLARLFRSQAIDVVHTRNWGTVDAILGARMAGVPLVVHGEQGRDMSDPEGRNRKRILVRRGLASLVDRHVAVSRQLREWLVGTVGLRSPAVQTICNGVDTGRFAPGDDRVPRERLGFAEHEVLVGTIGRLDPVKDQQLLVRAFARAARGSDDLRLLLVGDGPCRAELEALVEELELTARVTFYGLRSDTPELLRALDLFVLPSIAEGISNTILEAMASGLAVIATGVGGNSELVDDGVTGCLVPRSAVEPLAGAIDRYARDAALRHDHGAAARRRAVTRFSLNGMVRQYERLYEGLAGRI